VHTASASSPRSTAPAGDVFGHILVGIDDTPESLVAAAQAEALRVPGGRLVLVAVAERYLAAHAGFAALDAEGRIVEETSRDLARAAALIDADETMLRSGRLVPVLARECASRGATLVAIGAQPHRGVPARVLGGHDVEALHDAACSLLIARPGWGRHRPDRIVVGIDGTPSSTAAAVVARSLAARVGSGVVPVVGLEDAVDLAASLEPHPDALLDTGTLGEAVARATTPASLVIVGQRSDDGSAAAEVLRQVYRLRCSVLVLRGSALRAAEAAEART
jgi:nucleotide-binding universal stress UspA family protein